MAVKPIGYAAANKLTLADDASGLSGLPAATGLSGQVPQANGGLGVDASALSNGVLVKSGGAMSSTTAPTMSGANITSNSLPGSALATASVPVAKITGGTLGRLLYDNGTELDYTAVGTSGYLLQSNGGVIAPSWTNTIVGISISGASNTITNLPTSSIAPAFLLAATQGGTGQTSYAVGDLLYASTTTALSKLAASTSGYVLTANGAGVAPSWQAPSVATNSTSSLSSSQYNISATDTYEDIGLSVTLPAAGTYRVWVNLTVGGRIAGSPNGLITFKLYNSTDAADVSNSERTAPWITHNTVGIVDNVAFEETITVAASKTIKVYAKKNSGPIWTDAYISSATDGRSRIGYVKY